MAESRSSVLAQALREARRLNASPRERKALVLAGLVESNLQHERYARPGSGDRDSVGFLQQRPSQGWGPPGESVAKDTRDFLKRAQSVNRSGFKGSAGQLAQAVQRSAYPGKYDQRSAEAERLLRGAGGGRGGGGGGGVTDTPGDSRGPTPAPGVGLADLAGLVASLQEPERPPSMGLQAPAHAARVVLPDAAQPIPSVAPPAKQGEALSEALSQIAAMPGVSLPQRQPAPAEAAPGGSGGSSGGRTSSGPGGAGRYPLTRRGKLIGTPHAGTHTLGNWQSDNAIDLRTPVGTPIRALEDGVVGKVVNRPSGGGRFAGGQITLNGKGNSYFYGHTSKINVKAGQRVKKGQIIGRTGSANGVPHLHLGVQRGDPRKIIGQGR